jgi:hypothetical protein
MTKRDSLIANRSALNFEQAIQTGIRQPMMEQQIYMLPVNLHESD